MSSQPRAQTHARRQVASLSSLSTIRPWRALRRLAALAPGRRKSASTSLSPPSFLTRPGSSIPTDSHLKGSFTTGKKGRRWIGEKFKKVTKRRQREVTPIDVLPDEILLAIFGFCAESADEDSNQYPDAKQEMEAWQSLVHVCRRWRSVVFGSPNRLNLQLVCTAKTPARDTLGVWPAFPLHIQDRDDPEEGLDNIIAVLECSDRVYAIDLRSVSSLHLEKLSAAMQVPFLELTHLQLRSYGEVAIVLPDSFLGGSTPRLRLLSLDSVPFPGLPKLLLSATHLVTLHLENIPHSGYISPEAILTALSTLSRLDELMLEFQSPQSRPDPASRRPLSPTRSVLSILTCFGFKGDNEYLDNLMAYIDAPQLNELYTIFFNQIVFDMPQLIQFICRTPRLKGFENAHVIFDGDATAVNFSSLTSGDDVLRVEISCRELDWQVSSLEQVCTSSLPPLSALKDLYIYEGQSSREHWKDNIENVLWLELLHPFRAVKNLYLSEEFAPRIVPALEELVESTASEVLPALQNIFLGGLRPSRRVQEGIRQFVATRQVNGDPITISRWDSSLGQKTGLGSTVINGRRLPPV